MTVEELQHKLNISSPILNMLKNIDLRIIHFIQFLPQSNSLIYYINIDEKLEDLKHLLKERNIIVDLIRALDDEIDKEKGKKYVSR